jgi:hypothetical protein
MKVVLTDEAKAQVRQRRAWWRNNRVHKGLFSEAMLVARSVLSRGPKLMVHGRYDGLEVRRLSMPKVHCFVYYTIDEEQQLVTVISVWGQEVEHQPDFVGRSK